MEGPSAVGKTTLVAALAASMSGHVVPELETIDAPPRSESAGWFADQSSRRWQEARALAAGTQAVLLDGDPFKGLWYAAVFRHDGSPDPKLVAVLYRERIENGWLAWPDLYLALDADETELTKRRAADPTRRRRRFESHLRLLAPLREYFGALAERLPGRVLLLDTTRLSPDAVVDKARQLIARTDPHVETPRAALVEELANKVCRRPWGRESWRGSRLLLSAALLGIAHERGLKGWVQTYSPGAAAGTEAQLPLGRSSLERTGCCIRRCMMRKTPSLPMLVLMSICSGAVATLAARATDAPDPSAARLSVIRRSQVWRRTQVDAMDLKSGPREDGAFPFRATVHCNYLDRDLGGHSPKFACTIGQDDEVKVKFGGTNGEVYGEVLATRLLWALGFGADRMYPVNVICHGCPSELGGIERPGDESRFDPAVIERKMPGGEWAPDDKPGWSWKELDILDAESGGAPRAHRDALKLLAVFLQHTDNKPEQQVILCLGQGRALAPASCERPFLMISDVGLTFGRASRTNGNDSGVNLVAWQRTPVWKDGAGCTGNLPKSFTGTLDDPVISEDGRHFLATLLTQLSDRQIRDLFEVARVELRLRSPGDVRSGFATLDEWVDAFKQKRDQIVSRRCA